MLMLKQRVRPNKEVGGLIWEIVEGRYSLEEMVGVIADRHEVSAEQVQADVKRIVEELVQENLVHEADGAVRSGDSPSGNGGENGPYESPQLNIYRDMGDLTALDPPMHGLADTPWKEPDGDSTKKPDEE